MSSFSPVVAIAAYTFLEGLRNRLVWLVVAFLVAAVGMAEFTGALAITESIAFRSGLLGALLRLFAVFVLSLFVITSMVREFNDKHVELLLSLPITRASYFFGKVAGFFFLIVPVVLLSALCLLLYVPWEQVLLWALSLLCELLIVVAFSVLCLFTFNQVILALSAVAAFYLLARSIGAMELIGHGPLAPLHSVAHDFMNAFVAAIAFVLPDLDRFSPSAWLVYHTGHWSDLLPILGQTLIYLLLLSGAALFDLYRKNL